MNGSADNRPLVARLGLTHVSIAQANSGNWFVMGWNGNFSGPRILSRAEGCEDAVTRAKLYAERTPGTVLDLPEASENGEARHG